MWILWTDAMWWTFLAVGVSMCMCACGIIVSRRRARMPPETTKRLDWLIVLLCITWCALTAVELFVPTIIKAPNPYDRSVERCITLADAIMVLGERGMNVKELAAMLDGQILGPFDTPMHVEYAIIAGRGRISVRGLGKVVVSRPKDH